MPVAILLSLLAGTLCAAAGQILFKVGATGRESLWSFLNVWIISGLFLYGVGTLFWIFSLSRVPLTVVYPFTALTFVLVYLGGVLILGEHTSLRAIAGVFLVLGGLYLISSSEPSVTI